MKLGRSRRLLAPLAGLYLIALICTSYLHDHHKVQAGIEQCSERAIHWDSKAHHAGWGGDECAACFLARHHYAAWWGADTVCVPDDCAESIVIADSSPTDPRALPKPLPRGPPLG